MKIIKNSIINIIKSRLITLPTPSNISRWWNFGSLLGICLIIQLLSGLFLAIHYSSDIRMAFRRVINIHYNINYGWLIKILHINGASLIFICLYLHIIRGIYYNSFFYSLTWNSGIIIYLIIITTAFIGYILPWRQISFWGATVITNLLSVIPYSGTFIVNWLWGGFRINNATLMRFFTLHFILPFILVFIVLIHLIFLHNKGSNNPLGSNKNIDIVFFYPYFFIKDLFGFLFTLIIILIFILRYPNILVNPDNFIEANPIITPIHIEPEWYFLFIYAILRSIPNKLGGVLTLILSIIILFIIPLIKKNIQRNIFYPLNKLLMWTLFRTFILLTWIGMRPVEEPFIQIGQLLTINYFFIFPLLFFFTILWDKYIFKILN